MGQKRVRLKDKGGGAGKLGSDFKGSVLFVFFSSPEKAPHKVLQAARRAALPCTAIAPRLHIPFAVEMQH